MAPHSSTLAWKIPRKVEPGRLQSTGSLRVRHDWMTSLSLFTFTHWRRKWQSIPVFLPGESQGRGRLVGCRLRGRRVGHDWSDLAAAARRAEVFWLGEGGGIWQNKGWSSWCWYTFQRSKLEPCGLEWSSGGLQVETDSTDKFLRKVIYYVYLTHCLSFYSLTNNCEVLTT